MDPLRKEHVMSNWMVKIAFAGAAIALGSFIGTVSAQTQVDAALLDYKPTSGVSGTIKSIGSDTMNNQMTLWAEGFHKHYPAVNVEIEGKGSTTAPPALISG